MITNIKHTLPSGWKCVSVDGWHAIECREMKGGWHIYLDGVSHHATRLNEVAA